MIIPDIYVYAFGLVKGEMSIALANLIAESDSDDRLHDHDFAEILDRNTSINITCITALCKALDSIRKEYWNSPIHVYYNSPYLKTILTKNDDNEWKTIPKANIEYVEQMRELISNFSNIEFIKYANNNEHYQKLKKIALDVVECEVDLDAQC